MKKTYSKRFGFAPNPEVAAEIANLDALQDCQRIAHLLTAYDFAWDITRSLEVALFYTYGSASVSKLLDRTGEFEKFGQKRYDDTRLLIAHFMESGWDGDVGRRALERMNKTHGNYRIPNEDFLFVLWTFIDFPIQWTAQYSWRAMTAHEQLAWFNFWYGIGERMGLQDIPKSKANFDAFVDTYKQREFYPDAASERVAKATVKIMEDWLPTPMRSSVQGTVAALFDDELFLQAVGIEPAPQWRKTLIRQALRQLGMVKRVVAIGRYPDLIEKQPNRTYPGNRYEVEDLQPVHLKRREERSAQPESVQ